MPEVQLSFNIGAAFNVDLADRLTVFVGLNGDKIFANPVIRKGAYFVQRIRQLDTTRLASATCMNLHLNHPAIAANFLCAATASSAVSTVPLNGQAILRKQTLGLILV